MRVIPLDSVVKNIRRLIVAIVGLPKNNDVFRILDQLMQSPTLQSQDKNLRSLHEIIVDQDGVYHEELCQYAKVFILIEKYRWSHPFGVEFGLYKRTLSNLLLRPDDQTKEFLSHDRLYSRALDMLRNNIIKMPEDAGLKNIGLNCIRICLEEAIEYEHLIHKNIHAYWQDPETCNGDYQKLCQTLRDILKSGFHSNDQHPNLIIKFWKEAPERERDIIKDCLLQYVPEVSYTAFNLPEKILNDKIFSKLEKTDRLAVALTCHSQFGLFKGKQAGLPALIFTREKFYTPAVRVYREADSGTEIANYEDFIRHYKTRKVKPQSETLAALLNDGGPVAKHLPSWDLASAECFDLIDELNKVALKFPKDFFLNGGSASDTAFSRAGLVEFTGQFSRATELRTSVFVEPSKFLTFVADLTENELTEPLACLVCFEPSKRHVTGFYFDRGKAVYIFDTTGLTLPAQPCGLRGYNGSYIPELNALFAEFIKKKIEIAVMPVNTVISLQKDSYSCLTATILFFMGMKHKAFQMLSEPGIAECYGSSCFYKKDDNKSFCLTITYQAFPTLLYTSRFVPLLVGIQSTLGFLFALDSLENADEQAGMLIKLRSDWQRKIPNSKKSEENKTHNVFWQIAYLKLLEWFQAVYQGHEVAFPDFEALCHSSLPRLEKTAFEEKFEPQSSTNMVVMK